MAQCKITKWLPVGCKKIRKIVKLKGKLSIFCGKLVRLNFNKEENFSLSYYHHKPVPKKSKMILLHCSAWTPFPTNRAYARSLILEVWAPPLQKRLQPRNKVHTHILLSETLLTCLKIRDQNDVKMVSRKIM